MTRAILFIGLLMILVAGFVGIIFYSPSKRTLPQGKPFDAIYEKFGEPDRLTGSGRSFLHYDLQNNQTLILVVSGDSIIDAEISRKP